MANKANKTDNLTEVEQVDPMDRLDVGMNGAEVFEFPAQPIQAGEPGASGATTPNVETENSEPKTLLNTAGNDLFKCLQDEGFVTFEDGHAVVKFGRVQKLENNVYSDFEYISVPALALAGMNERAIKKLVVVLDPDKGTKAQLKKLLAATPGITPEEVAELLRQVLSEG